ncbi:hypothetical protein [Microbacterium sp. LWH10-1.2]|uniref:hypothetical protein n=1 Tax=Microbacterium sp. LWH10-1.2 TaxID=3135255 RepID=UPI0031389A6F
MESRADYWALLAQVMPVVMLALVVEGRFMSRQLARKRSYSTNGNLRMAYAVIFIVNCLGLFLGFGIALRGATGTEVGPVGTFMAENALNLGVSTVFLTPLLSVTAALVGDKITATHRKMPYSEVSRREARKRIARIALSDVRREAAVARLWARGEIANLYVHAYAKHRLSPKMPGDTAEFDAAIDEIDSAVEWMGEKFAAMAGKLESAEETFKARGELVSDQEIRELRALLKQVSGL